MSEDYSKLIEQMRQAERAMTQSVDEGNLMERRHRDETEQMNAAQQAAMRRCFILRDTLRRVIEHDLTVEQAKMITHEELEGRLVDWQHHASLVPRRKTP